MISSVGYGEKHTLMLDNNGHVWGMGDNSNGSLGMENQCVEDNQGAFSYFQKLLVPKLLRVKRTRIVPNLNPYLSNIISVACGKDHSVCLDSQGSVWVFGYNPHGLGIPDTISSYHPLVLEQIPFITSISCGDSFTMLLDVENCVWSFGANDEFQLCLGHDEDVPTPQQVTEIPPITSIQCHESRTLLINDAGQVYMGGDLYKRDSISSEFPNFLVQIPIEEPISLVALSGDNSFALNELGEVYTWLPETFEKPTKLPHRNIRAICGGSAWFAFFITTNNTIIIHADKPIYDFPDINALTALSNVHSAYCGTTNYVIKTMDGRIWYQGLYIDGQERIHGIGFHAYFPIRELPEYYASKFKYLPQTAKSARK